MIWKRLSSMRLVNATFDKCRFRSLSIYVVLNLLFGMKYASQFRAKSFPRGNLGKDCCSRRLY